MAEFLQQRIDECVAVLKRMRDDDELADTLAEAAERTVAALRSGGRVLLCGNGGSAADAQHLAAELVGRFMLEREPLAALALSDNVSALTAIGNDYSYEEVFARGVKAHGRAGDVLVGISTSGRSENVVRALQVGEQRGLTTIALVGSDDCPMAEVAHYTLSVAGPNTARIQEGQKLLGHTFCELVEAGAIGVT